MKPEENKREDTAVLCGANAYEEKYYYNKFYDKVPESIKQELNIICVLFTQEVGGIFTISFDEDGQILLNTMADEEDITYDEISAGLLVSKIRRERKEMFDALSLYYRVLVLKEDPAVLLEDGEAESI